MRIILTFLLFLPVFSFGQHIIWDEKDSFQEIGDKVELLEDTTGKLTYDQVQLPEFNSKFIVSDKINLSLGYTESFFWIRFVVDNSSENEIVLEVAQAGLPIADLYYKNDNSKVKHVASGYQVPVNSKIIQSSFQAFPLPTGKTTCYIRLNSNSEPVPVRLYKKSAYETNTTKQKFGYGIYLGLMLFVALINLFFFISLKKRIYLFYSFIVLLYIGYSAAVIDGFIVYFIPNVDLIFLYTTIPAIGITIQTLYCLLFLETKKYTPKVYRTVLAIVVYFGVWAILKFFFSFPIVQPINTVNALISFFVMGYVGVKVGRKGNKLGYYFAIAYFIYFLLVSMQAIYINTGSPEYFGGLSHVAYATLIEAFLLSFLLSKRSEWERVDIEKDKLEAQQKVIEATQDKERMVEEQNALLEIEVEKRTEQLQEQHNELEKLNSTKDHFFSIISHDLRGPVNAFSGLSTLVKLSVENKDYDQLPEMAERLDYSSNQLTHLLDNLLNWAVNQKGEIPFTPEKIELKFMIEHIFNTFKNMADSKKIHLESTIPKDIFITADRNTVMTIFRNLVNNAIKFTEEGGMVSLSAISKEGLASIKIADTGIGIAKDRLETIFQLKEDKGQGTAGEKGLGLGLRLVSEFVALNKGSIAVESKEGVGATFTIEIPLFEI
jgi:two-component system, sensor histidine kinase LadS